MRIMDSLESGTTDAIRSVEALRRTGYEVSDLGTVTRDVAALWERSLKACDPGWSGKSLYEITRVLEAAGWTAAPPSLDMIRTGANRDKHDPAPPHDIDQLVGALQTLQAELPSLPNFASGATSMLPPALRVRRMVCAVYEFFHTGETIYAFLEAGPDDTWKTANGIDEFQVENKHTSAIEDRLAELPAYALNPPELARLEQSLLESDSELWKVIRIDASYQQVHDILAPYQHSLPLLGGLHREDDALNFIASVAQALLTGQPPMLSDRSPLDYSRVRTAVQSLMDSVPDRLKPLRLDRCSPLTFTEQSRTSVVVDEELGTLVTSRGVLLVRAT